MITQHGWLFSYLDAGTFCHWLMFRWRGRSPVHARFAMIWFPESCLRQTRNLLAYHCFLMFYFCSSWCWGLVSTKVSPSYCISASCRVSKVIGMYRHKPSMQCGREKNPFDRCMASFFSGYLGKGVLSSRGKPLQEGEWKLSIVCPLPVVQVCPLPALPFVIPFVKMCFLLEIEDYSGLENHRKSLISGWFYRENWGPTLNLRIFSGW